MNLRNDPSLINFVKLASEYTLLIEKLLQKQEVSVSEMSKAVAALYVCALDLPEIDLPAVNLNPEDKFKISHDQWKDIYDAIGGSNNFSAWYWTYFDVTDQLNAKEQPICHSIADDLADIYRDLKSGLDAWATGNDAYIPEIVFEWKFSCQSHWGRHAVNAMRALHELRQNIRE